MKVTEGAVTRPASGAGARRGVLSNFLNLGASSIVGSVLALLATAHLARALGVESFGAFNLGRTLVEYALIPTTFGITVTASRAISASRDGRPELAGTVVAMRAVMGLVGLAVLGIIWLFVENPETRVAIASMALCVPLVAVNVDWLYGAHEDQRWPGVVRTLGRAAYAGLVLIVVSVPEDLRLAGIALCIEALLMAALMWWPARRWVTFRRSALTLKRMWAHLQDSLHVGTAGLALRLKTNADLLILGVAGTASAVGYYSAAYRLVLFVNALAGLYATVLLPRVARASAEGDVHRVASAGLRLSIVVGVAVSAGGAAVAGLTITTLMGMEYAPAAGVTTILMAAAGFVVMSLSLGYSVIAMGGERAYGAIATSAAVVNIGVNLVVIPRFGMLGAAVTTLATEIGLAVGAGVLVRRFSGGSPFTAGWLARAALLAIAVFSAPWAVLQVGGGLWIAVLAGVACWTVATPLLALVTRSDIRALTRETAS